MALKSFGRGGMEDGMPAAPAPSGGGGGPGGLTAFIDQGSEFEGKLSFRDTVRIDGRFRGEISSENNLIVGETEELYDLSNDPDELVNLAHDAKNDAVLKLFRASTVAELRRTGAKMADALPPVGTETVRARIQSEGS